MGESSPLRRRASPRPSPPIHAASDRLPTARDGSPHKSAPLTRWPVNYAALLLTFYRPNLDNQAAAAPASPAGIVSTRPYLYARAAPDGFDQR